VAKLVTGTIVRLPDDAEPPFTVYLNGVLQSEGSDFDVEGGALRFLRPLTVGKPDGLWQKLVMSTAGVGYYGQGDSVDVDYRRADGSTAVVTGLRVEPDG
jgi:hypothetical protein